MGTLHLLSALTSETVESEGSAHAGLIGGGILLVLLILLVAVVAFGGGREHS